MLSQESLDVIRKCARDYDVESVWLFGSALEDEATAHDIDLAVEGIDPRKFYDFYGSLFFSFRKPVDLVDMSEEIPIVILIRAQGVRIYERGS
jgi:predicted nucleotidyltransferase